MLVLVQYTSDDLGLRTVILRSLRSLRMTKGEGPRMTSGEEFAIALPTRVDRCRSFVFTIDKE